MSEVELIQGDCLVEMAKMPDAQKQVRMPI